MSHKAISNTLLHLSAFTKHYNPGEHICKEGEDFPYIGILLSGKIQYTKTYLTGECLTLKILEAPQSFNEEAACTHTPASFTLCALENTTAILIPRNNLLFMNKNSYNFMGPFLSNLLRLVAHRSSDIQCQVNYGRITSLKKRVAAYLLEHYKKTGNCLFTVSQTRCEMAAYLNATRPALSKVLSELKKEQIIDYYKDSFKIQDLEALKRQ